MLLHEKCSENDEKKSPGGDERRCGFGGADVTVRVSNPEHVETGVRSLAVDGVQVDGDVAPAALLRDGAVVEVVLG